MSIFIAIKTRTMSLNSQNGGKVFAIKKKTNKLAHTCDSNRIEFESN